MKNTADLFIPIRSLVEGKHRFLVKDYQRGYKWTESHISALLNDVNHHKDGNGKYCLQPLIVAPTESPAEYELIDGQQRLTSIYLLLSFLQNDSAVGYTLSYATREKSRQFIDEKVSSLFAWLEENGNDATWEDFIEDEQFSAFDNVDVYHFFIVARAIHQWFKKRSDTVDKEAFLVKLLDQVNVIWYDASLRCKENGESLGEHFAEDVFLNLNAGKIPLTGSELIKALFILECRDKYSKEVALLKTNELAAEWDAIENSLQDDTFWYFLCNDPFYSEAGTRIDFLLDLVNGCLGKKDRLAAYRAYEQTDRPLDWQAVKHDYNKLLEWYHDKMLFHYVGFIIAARLPTYSIDKILKESKGKSKAEFLDHLEGVIKREFSRTARDEGGVMVDVYNLDTLNYEDNRMECERLLLFLNVCHFINGHSANRFPFDLYRKDRWSVEHINPQNPRDFTTVGELRQWLKAQKDYFLSIDNDSDLKEGKEAVEKHAPRIESSLVGVADSQLLKSSMTERAGELIDTLVGSLTTHLGLHLMGNLALLDKATNSRLSNKLFMEKRGLVLQFDSVGHTDEGDEKKPVFIPVCTKNVFSKIYTKSESSVANTFFGKRDMDDYVTTIREQLSGFLKPLSDNE